MARSTSATGYVIDQQEYARQLRMLQDQYFYNQHYQQRPSQACEPSGVYVGYSTGVSSNEEKERLEKLEKERLEKLEKEKKLKKLIAYYYGRRK